MDVVRAAGAGAYMNMGLLSLVSDLRGDARSRGQTALDLGEPTMATGIGTSDLIQGAEMFAVSKDFSSDASL